MFAIEVFYIIKGSFVIKEQEYWQIKYKHYLMLLSNLNN